MRLTPMLVIIFFFGITYAASPASLSTVDQYVAIAVANDAIQLKGSGSMSCEYAMKVTVVENEPDFKAFGQTVQEANQRLALVCIKERCQQAGQWIMKGLEQFDQVGDTDNAEFLKTQGYTDEQIANVLKNRAHMDRSGLAATTCATGSPLTRMAVFDSCFATPMSCGPKKD